MNKQYRKRPFFTFKDLAEDLGISQNRIENDYKIGNLARLSIDDQNTKALRATRRRIAKLLPRLNEYAREHIDQSPLSLLAVPNGKLVSISESQKERLRSIVSSEEIFRLWLSEYGININNMKLVIMPDEALAYEKYLKDDSGNNTERKTLPEITQIPEDYIFDLRAQGEEDAVIAVHLKQKFPNISGCYLMKAINPDKVAEWEQSTAKVGRPKQLFYDLKKKGLQILKEREKMTSSDS